jgi:uncharacterized protein (DUF1778 family)
MEGMMEFKITEAEAPEMAKFEEEAGCDVWATPEAYAEFVRLLDAPPQPNDRLRKTILTMLRFGALRYR